MRSYRLQGLSRFSLVAASAAQTAAGAMQAGTRDITAKVELLRLFTILVPGSNTFSPEKCILINRIK